MSKQYYAIIIFLLILDPSQSKLLDIEEFYSQSFVPNDLIISYHIENNTGINYNLTAMISFSGKLLLSIFLRRLPDATMEKSQTMLKYKNLDFCKSLETIKNITADNFNAAGLLQPTFITSCPLNNGFYYIHNGNMDDDAIPSYFDTGRYWIQMELVQVFDEVIKLLNMRFKINFVKSEEEDDELNEEEDEKETEETTEEK